MGCSTFTSAASAAWGLPTTWNSGLVPAACNPVVIRAVDVVTATATVTIASMTVNGSLTLDSGGGAFTFTMQPGGLTTTTGSTFVQGTGNNLVIYGNTSLAAGTFTKDAGAGKVYLKGDLKIDAQGQSLGWVVVGP